MRASSVRPITDLKTHTKDVIDQAIHSGEPILITQNGRASVVIIDAKCHDDAQATLAMLKLLAQSQDSLARGDKIYSSEDVRRRARAAIGQSKTRRIPGHSTQSWAYTAGIAVHRRPQLA
jgi:prevent-host-death family protein